MDQLGSAHRSGNETKGLVCIWQGFHGEISPSAFDVLQGQTVQDVAMGAGHTLILTDDRKIFVLGSNQYGQLGLGNLETEKCFEPVQLEFFNDKNIKSIACGTHHSGAISEDGYVYCWGRSLEGQCGTGELTKVASPTNISFFLPDEHCEHGVLYEHETVQVKYISLGNTHSMAVSYENEIWVWGSGGHLGFSATTELLKPSRLDYFAGRNILSISCGETHNAVLLEKSDLTADGDRRRSSSLSSEQIKTNRYYPSTCAKCNTEIYSYTETQDTCIINRDHHCDSVCEDNGASLFEKSVTSITSVNTENDTPAYVLEKYDDSIVNISTVVPGDQTISAKEPGLSDLSMDQNVVPSQEDSEKFSDAVESKSVQTGNVGPGTSQENIRSDEECNITPGDNSTPILDSIGSVQSDSDAAVLEEIWVKKSDSDLQRERRRSGSTLSVTSLTKTKSFLDSKAREFLEKQMQDDPADTDNTSSSKIGDVLASVAQPVVQRMTSITGQALSNIKTTVVDTFNYVSGQGVELENLSKSDSQDLLTCDETDVSLSLPGSSPSGSGSREDLFLSNTSLSETGTDFVHLDKQDVLDAVRKSSQSLKTLKAREEKLQKKVTSAEKVNEKEVAPMILDTEVWTWGKNSKGELGLGDMIDRPQPSCIKVFQNRNAIKIVCGSHHTIALTASFQVYSWGMNTSGQLGHHENSATPHKIKFPGGTSVFDVAAGENHSLFLSDAGGYQADVYYCGKHPCNDLYTAVHKTTKPTLLPFLKKLGYFRSIFSGADDCACVFDKCVDAQRATMYEFASTERKFVCHWSKINTTLIKPLLRSAFYTSLDVYPYKSTLHNLLASFQSLLHKAMEGNLDLLLNMKEGKDILSATVFCNYSEFVSAFKKYITALGDFIAINGFEYCIKTGSSFFDKVHDIFSDLMDEKKVDSLNAASCMRWVMQTPLRRLEEYGKFSHKLALGYSHDSYGNNLLHKVALNWDSLEISSNNEIVSADVTRAFWETTSSKIADTLRIPSRRLIKDSKSQPLILPTAGRFSSHTFLLFNDLFVHVQNSSHIVHPLETMWVEAHTADEDNHQNAILITVPEDAFLLTCPDPAGKAEWLMSLNAAINKTLTHQKKSAVKRRNSIDRLMPPLIRYASHTFLKHGVYKDSTYKGYWLNGKVHGQGEIKWADGRKYVGRFKQGFQHGHGKFTKLGDNGKEEIKEGNWKDGKMNGLGSVRFSNGDKYEGYFKDGLRSGHGVYYQRRHNTSASCIYIGEWITDRRHGYGVMDDIMKGEKYMGMWVDDYRHGTGIVVTLDGMYFEGIFSQSKMTGLGLMLTDDNSCYEGEFNGITQLYGKGTLTLPTGDKIEGAFNGTWNEGLKINGSFIKCNSSPPINKEQHNVGVQCSMFGKRSVPANKKWENMFLHCYAVLGFSGEGKVDTKKAWESVAVSIASGKKTLRDLEKTSTSRIRHRASTLDDLEKIPHSTAEKLTTEAFREITDYMKKAFDTPYHPLGKLMEGLVDVFRASYIGIGAHPRLLYHAVEEVKSYVIRIYRIIRILFPNLRSDGQPEIIHPRSFTPVKKSQGQSFDSDEELDDESELVSAEGLLHPFLLPRIYPPLFDLYALYNEKEDQKYWERVQKLNRQGDIALMAYLGIDQKFWLIDDQEFEIQKKKLSSLKDQCYSGAVDMLQHLSTAFSPIEKLQVIEKTFQEITKAVIKSLGEDYIWCMDDLFPIFQFVVVRSKIRHLGAEVHSIDDLMESHLEHGEFGLMFTTLKACYFQIQNEKLPNH